MDLCRELSVKCARQLDVFNPTLQDPVIPGGGDDDGSNMVFLYGVFEAQQLFNHWYEEGQGLAAAGHSLCIQRI